MDDLQKMASELAAECIAVQKEIGDERLFIQVASVLGASSQTLEEAFLTNVRTKMAAEKAQTKSWGGAFRGYINGRFFVYYAPQYICMYTHTYIQFC